MDKDQIDKISDYINGLSKEERSVKIAEAVSIPGYETFIRLTIKCMPLIHLHKMSVENAIEHIIKENLKEIEDSGADINFFKTKLYTALKIYCV
jgi:predicted MarR family transcription regulator